MFLFSSSDGNVDDGGGGGGGQHLVNAGHYLQAAAESVGPENYAGPHLLKDAGDSLIDIGRSWSTSWESVTYAADEAAEMFYELSMLQEQPQLQKLYGASCGELKEIASISGCTSIGPPSAVPNLEALSQCFQQAAKFVEESGVVYQDCRQFGISLRKASQSIQALAKEYE